MAGFGRRMSSFIFGSGAVGGIDQVGALPRFLTWGTKLHFVILRVVLLYITRFKYSFQKLKFNVGGQAGPPCIGSIATFNNGNFADQLETEILFSTIFVLSCATVADNNSATMCAKLQYSDSSISDQTPTNTRTAIVMIVSCNRL